MLNLWKAAGFALQLSLANNNLANFLLLCDLAALINSRNNQLDATIAIYY